MNPRIPRTLLLTALATAAMAAIGASSAFAGQATTTRYVALTGSVGAGTSCSSPGYVGIDGVQDAIDAATPGDVIHICAGTWHTGDLAAQGFTTDKTLTIEGDGQSQTYLDAAEATDYGGAPAISLTDSSSSLTVRDLTIQNADTEGAGAIGSDGPLTVVDVTLYRDGFIAIGADSTLTIRRSTMTGFPDTDPRGPFVLSAGSTTIEDSTFSDNVAVDAPTAGVWILGNVDEELTVDSSTFTALSSPVCISTLVLINEGEGTTGGITINNSTFTGNTAGNSECPSGHILSSGYLDMRNSTFAGNTGVRDSGYGDGELFSYDGMTLSNDIIIGDPDAEMTCQASASVETNDGGNVISDETVGCDAFVGGASPSPQAKVPTSSIDLGPLAENGGPTETMALGAASVARGAAIAAECPATDQRGYKRDSACDSGAYEYGAGPGGKPKLKQKGRAGANSLRVKVDCGGSAPCRIKLSGVLKAGSGKLVSKTVRVGAKGKNVTLDYTGELKRALRARGGSGKVRVLAREVGGSKAATLVRVTLPDAVTG